MLTGVPALGGRIRRCRLSSLGCRRPVRRSSDSIRGDSVVVSDCWDCCGRPGLLGARRDVRCGNLGQRSKHQNEACGDAGGPGCRLVREQRRSRRAMAVSKRVRWSRSAHTQFPSAVPTLRKSTGAPGNLKNSHRQAEQSRIVVLNLPPDQGRPCQCGTSSDALPGLADSVRVSDEAAFVVLIRRPSGSGTEHGMCEIAARRELLSAGLMVTRATLWAGRNNPT